MAGDMPKIEAPYPADTRAKGWRFELDYEQIEQSDTWALTPAEYRPWLLMLWLTAWKQTPAGSLPANDELIAARIGMPMPMFVLARDVLLRGWWEADDGRLYHDTIAQRVSAMLATKEKERLRKAAYRERMSQGVPKDDSGKTKPSTGSPKTVPRDKQGTDPGRDDTGTGTGTGTGLSNTETSTHTTTSSAVDGLVAYEGTFDGHEGSQAITPNPVAPFAIALTKAGVRVTTLNPELIAYQQEGGSVDHLMQLVQMDEFCGKPAGYVLKAARRELAEKPSGIRLSIHPYQSRPVSNTEQGLVGLERLKKRPRT